MINISLIKGIKGKLEPDGSVESNTFAKYQN
jgi:hypothetical protein